jgi:hypothetical protein
MDDSKKAGLGEGLTEVYQYVATAYFEAPGMGREVLALVEGAIQTFANELRERVIYLVEPTNFLATRFFIKNGYTFLAREDDQTFRYKEFAPQEV